MKHGFVKRDADKTKRSFHTQLEPGSTRLSIPAGDGSCLLRSSAERVGAQQARRPDIAVQLAAGAGALALALVNQSEAANAIAIFAAGSQDNQSLMLSRLGLKTVSGIEPVISTEYDDVMYCTRTQKLQRRFQRMMDAMANTMGIDQMLLISVLDSR